MDSNMKRLEKLNERYTLANMTGFKLVTKRTDKKTVLRHFEMDVEILKTSSVKLKDVVRVILRDDVIDICSYDNGTPVAYFFTCDADFRPEDIAGEIREICNRFEVDFERGD